MSSKTLIYIGVAIGSTLGGYLPLLWGAGLLSISSVVCSAIGGILGLVITYKLINA